MHEKRNELFFKRRLGIIDFSQDEKETLAEIVHSEFENLASMDWNEAAMSLSPKNSPQKMFSVTQNEINTSLPDESFEIEEEIEGSYIFFFLSKLFSFFLIKNLVVMFQNNGFLMNFKKYRGNKNKCPLCLTMMACFVQSVSRTFFLKSQIMQFVIVV